MKRERSIGRLHVITDTRVQRRYSHEQLAALVASGGADTIQFRDKSMRHEGRMETAARIQELLDRFKIPLIVNDSIDIAVHAAAGGVHLGQTDAPIAEARRVLGQRAIIGATVSSVEEAIKAALSGADYLGFGHVFETRSKFKDGPALGLVALQEVCRAVKTPVIAIGGINEENVRSVMDAGAWGVAVVSAVCAADNPAAATDRLRGLVRN